MSSSSVEIWMQMQPTHDGAHVETFEHEQQRRFLTQLLASPSELYVHAAAFGISPAAFRLKCWKVRTRPQCQQHSCLLLVTPLCSAVFVCQQELATLQGIIISMASKPESKNTCVCHAPTTE